MIDHILLELFQNKVIYVKRQFPKDGVRRVVEESPGTLPIIHSH